MSDKVVLDASALLALIQNENGADVVRPLLKRAVMSTINIAEVLTALQRVEIQPKDAIVSICDFIQELIPFDIEQAQCAAELQPYVRHKGLSLGDACIALGQKLQAPVLDKLEEKRSYTSLLKCQFPICKRIITFSTGISGI